MTGFLGRVVTQSGAEPGEEGFFSAGGHASGGGSGYMTIRGSLYFTGHTPMGSHWRAVARIHQHPLTLGVSRIRQLEVLQDQRGMPHAGETASIAFSAYSGDFGHPFRTIPATQSSANRPPILAPSAPVLPGSDAKTRIHLPGSRPRRALGPIPRFYTASPISRLISVRSSTGS